MASSDIISIYTTKWRPMMAEYIDKGDIYCSKSCGFYCTRAAHDQAQKEAADICTRMGAGWTYRLWDNAGWHYNASNGIAQITINKKGGSTKAGWVVESYTGWINLGVARNAHVQFIERADTPEDALGIATQKVRAFLNAANEQFAKLCGAE